MAVLQSVVLLFLIAVLLVMVGILCYILYGLYITSQGAFFAPTSDERVRDLLELLPLKKGDAVVDLGSGDGKLLIALARAGAHPVGYEIDPWLLRKSRKNVADEGLSESVTIHRTNFWDVSLSEFDSIVVYGIDRVMKRLETKLEQELPSGTPVVSVFFTFPNWQHTHKKGDVRLYRVP